jgi:hypothetical protein
VGFNSSIGSSQFQKVNHEHDDIPDKAHRHESGVVFQAFGGDNR